MECKKIFVILLLFICISPLFSQENQVYSPFVSEIKTAYENSIIVITWKDSVDAADSSDSKNQAKYLVYRHNQEITRNNFSDARLLAEVLPGIQSYSDVIDNNNEYYYAVILRNGNGNVFNIFLPFRNTTSVSVSVDEWEKIKNITKITNIAAAVKNDTIIITFESSVAGKQLTILRHTSPIFTKKDIGKATVVNRITSAYKNIYKDYPLPGISYYYCVIDSDSYNSYVSLVQNQNTTEKSCEFFFDNDKEYALRQKPLPLYNLSKVIETGAPLSPAIKNKEKNISQKTASIANSLAIQNPIPTETLKPQMLEDIADKTTTRSTSSDEKKLKEVLELYFITRDWQTAETELKELSEKSSSKSFKNKCSFYIGQTLYFQNEKDKAYFEFFKASESYYPESQKWMTNILENK